MYISYIYIYIITIYIVIYIYIITICSYTFINWVLSYILFHTDQAAKAWMCQSSGMALCRFFLSHSFGRTRMDTCWNSGPYVSHIPFASANGSGPKILIDQFLLEEMTCFDSTPFGHAMNTWRQFATIQASHNAHPAHSIALISI